jgi:thiosulfate reductase cytochrome b subunit
MFFHQTHPARFAGWAFLALLVLFAGILNDKPAIGFTGIGSVLVLSSLLVLANRDRIWDVYKKTRHKSLWTKPSRLYYTLNVYVVWPIMLLLGLGAITAAYYLA